MNFEAIIGLEIHVEMSTKSKMFSASPVSFGVKPNSCVAPLDIAFPGSLPVVNKQAVINAIRVCQALHMEIDNELWFDRKNYFYSDLPKGFQITQHKRPIGKNGHLNLSFSNEKDVVQISRMQLEEDTCKQIHLFDKTLVDYNRAGIPLLEIVTCPDIHSGKQAKLFVAKIRSIVSFLNVSDAKMEEGTIRCDINISLRPIGSTNLNTKVEIKNVNTLSNIENAINYEIDRQTKVLLSGNTIKQETRRYDENQKKTIPMRIKLDEIDYRYFTEPNIVPIKLSNDFIKDAIETSPELADQKYERYLKLGLKEQDCRTIIQSKLLCDYFDEVINYGADPKIFINWLLRDIKNKLNENKIEIKDFPISSKNIASLIGLISEKKIDNKQAKEIFEQLMDTNEDPQIIFSCYHFDSINDKKTLLSIVQQVLDKNSQSIVDYKNGRDKALGFMIGEVLKASNGRANPKIVKEIILKKLEE